MSGPTKRRSDAAVASQLAREDALTRIRQRLRDIQETLDLIAENAVEIANWVEEVEEVVDALTREVEAPS